MHYFALLFTFISKNIKFILTSIYFFSIFVYVLLFCVKNFVITQFFPHCTSVCVYFFIHRIFLSRCMYVSHKTWKLLHNGALHEKFNMYNVGFSPILAGLLGCWVLVRLFIWVGVLQLSCFPLFLLGRTSSKRDGPIFIHIYTKIS